MHHFSEGDGTMAELVFQGHGHFGKSVAGWGVEEDGVVAETAGSAGFFEDDAIHIAFHDIHSILPH